MHNWYRFRNIAYGFCINDDHGDGNINTRHEDAVNIIDNIYGHDEFIEKVIAGVENTFKLIHEQKLFGFDTDAFDLYLKRRDCLKATRSAFAEAVQIEQNSRESSCKVSAALT